MGGEAIGFATVLYEKDEGVARVTLNRPRVLNALNVQMRDDLFEVFTAIRDDPEVRVAIVAGAGDRAFCAGADLMEFGSAPSPVEARAIRWERDLWGLILSLDTPLIAAVHGYALGAGCELALCCDLRLASEDAQFGLPEVALGMIPAAGGSQTLPRAMALGIAWDLLYTGGRLSAQEAYRWGLVNRVLPRPRLLPAAERLARKIASWEPRAVRQAKRLVKKALGDMVAEVR